MNPWDRDFGSVRPTGTQLDNHCTSGVIAPFTQCTGGDVVKPIHGDNISPWVKVAFGKQSGGTLNALITVGNKSAPGMPVKHRAAIKSFEYGFTDGHKGKVEIIDEEGGAFTQFADKLIKCMENVSKEYVMQCQWGWVVTNCNGSWNVESSPIVTFAIGNMEVSFNQGVIKYNITALDLGQVSFVGREDKAYGAENHKLELKQAMKKMMKDNEPKMNIIYKRKENGQTNGEWKWKSPEPKHAWTTDNQNKLGSMTRWVQPFRTDKDKGLVLTWDNTATDPTCIMWEHVGIDCHGTPSCGKASVIGTFVVNGGKCSNVISFSPNINWFTAFASLGTGGNAGGAANAGGVKAKNVRPNGCKFQTQNTGVMRSVEHTRQSLEIHGPKKTSKESEKSEMSHREANNQREGIQPIEAELRIQGNPNVEYVDVTKIFGTYATVVVINPFSLGGSDENNIERCDDWKVLADTKYNKVLSNRFWQIMGVNHQIKEGSYITTLKLKLAVPGLDLAPGRPLGADDLAWNPPNATC